MHILIHNNHYSTVNKGITSRQSFFPLGRWTNLPPPLPSTQPPRPVPPGGPLATQFLKPTTHTHHGLSPTPSTPPTTQRPSPSPPRDTLQPLPHRPLTSHHGPPSTRRRPLLFHGRVRRFVPQLLQDIGMCRSAERAHGRVGVVCQE